MFSLRRSGFRCLVTFLAEKRRFGEVEISEDVDVVVVVVQRLVVEAGLAAVDLFVVFVDVDEIDAVAVDVNIVGLLKRVYRNEHPFNKPT